MGREWGVEPVVCGSVCVCVCVCVAEKVGRPTEKISVSLLVPAVEQFRRFIVFVVEIYFHVIHELQAQSNKSWSGDFARGFQVDGSKTSRPDTYNQVLLQVSM